MRFGRLSRAGSTAVLSQAHDRWGLSSSGVALPISAHIGVL